MTDSRLHIPLCKLWPDIRVTGLPVVGFSPFSSPHWHAHFNVARYHVDLSRPGASDILARRVATSVGWDGLPEPPQWRHVAPPDWRLWEMASSRSFRGVGFADDAARFTDYVRELPALADLDPKDDTRLDWGALGSPRVVDLVALGMVARHLYAQEQK